MLTVAVGVTAAERPALPVASVPAEGGVAMTGVSFARGSFEHAAHCTAINAADHMPRAGFFNIAAVCHKAVPHESTGRAHPKARWYWPKHRRSGAGDHEDDLVHAPHADPEDVSHATHARCSAVAQTASFDFTAAFGQSCARILSIYQGLPCSLGALAWLGLKGGLEPRFDRGKLGMFDRPSRRARVMRALCITIGLTGACGGEDSKSNHSVSSVVTAGAAAVSQQPKGSGVTGTGNNCESYTLPKAEMCGSWYCGVNLQTLKQAISPAAVCGNSVELICTGSAVAAVADCARMIKLSMPFASNDVLRPMVRECALKDAQLQQGTKNECLDCIFDGFACTADNCLVQCLAGNTPDCDKCRLEAKCDQKSFECAGLPWPRN